MPRKVSLDNKKETDSIPKKTSIGHGRRKRGSFSVKGQKKYRGQVK